MNVLHLATHDIAGGGSVAAYNMHHGLRMLGVDSRMLVVNKTSNDPTVTAVTPSARLQRRLKRRLKRLWLDRRLQKLKSFKRDRHDFFSDIDSTFEITEQHLDECDVVVLHWVAGFASPSLMTAIKAARKPLAWYLHDANPLTGGCHYTGGCEQFMSKCNNCPAFTNNAARSLVKRNWLTRDETLRSFDESSVYVIGNSKWMTQMAAASTLLGRFRCETIHLPIDTHVFRPRDKRLARSVLGIPPHEKVVAFCAGSIGNHRKGFDLLLDSLTGVRRHMDVTLLAIGDCPRSPIADPKTIYTGRINHLGLMSMCYNAADCFVIPSRQEAFGMTTAEAMACGTPAVGFAVGGVPDVIEHGINGLLANHISGDALGDSIYQMLSDPACISRMSQAARKSAVEKFEAGSQAVRLDSALRSFVGPL